MSWLKLTEKSLFLMKGGTNDFLDKVDLNGTDNPAEYKLDIPKLWLKGKNAPRTIVIDVGSTEVPNQASSGFTSNIGFSTDNVLNEKNILKRGEWGAQAPNSRFEIIDRPQYIVIHHTDTVTSSKNRKEAGQSAKSIQNYHMNNNGWSDIGYNFLNTVSGILVEGRAGSLEEAIKGNSVRGAHAGANDGNASPGVANEGNFMAKDMDQAQWESLINLCAALCKSCNIDPKNIKGHRDFVKTDCPGDRLYNRLPDLISKVAEILK